MSPELKRRVQQYRQDGKNLFSTTEAILIGLTYPDLYQRIMPKRYQTEPMRAYFQELDGDQRQVVKTHHQGGM